MVFLRNEQLRDFSNGKDSFEMLKIVTIEGPWVGMPWAVNHGSTYRPRNFRPLDRDNRLKTRSQKDIQAFPEGFFAMLAFVGTFFGSRLVFSWGFFNAFMN